MYACVCVCVYMFGQRGVSGSVLCYCVYVSVYVCECVCVCWGRGAGVLEDLPCRASVALPSWLNGSKLEYSSHIGFLLPPDCLVPNALVQNMSHDILTPGSPQ